jgi:hypothetical protein
MTNALLAGLVLLVLAPPVAGEPAPTEVAANGPLHAHLIVTDRGAELLEQWAAGAPRITLKSVDSAQRGVFVTAVVRFMGCAPDVAGLCNSTVTYTAQRPDGTVYGEAKDVELWRGKRALDEGASQLAVEYLGLVFEPSDAAGTYTIVAEIQDHNAARKVTVSRTLQIP